MNKIINVIVKFSLTTISIEAIETIKLNNISIFLSYQKSKNRQTDIEFINKTIKKINHQINGLITKVVVLVDNSLELNLKLKSITKEIALVHNEVKDKDISNLFELIKNEDNVSWDQKMIFFQPALYQVYDDELKNYYEAPIGKTGKKLIVKGIVNSISTKTYNKITSILEATNLKIDYFLTSAHAIPHIALDQLYLKNGSASIHVDTHSTWVSLSYNNTILKFHLINNGYYDLLKYLSKMLGCDLQTAHNLFIAYGELDPEQIKINKVILVNKNGLTHQFITIKFLTTLIQKKVSLIFSEVKEYIKTAINDPIQIVISGEFNVLKSIDHFAKLQLDCEKIVIYQPFTNLETNQINLKYHGVVKYIERFNKNLHKQVKSIVITQPQLSPLLKNSSDMYHWKNIFKLKRRQYV